MLKKRCVSIKKNNLQVLSVFLAALALPLSSSADGGVRLYVNGNRVNENIIFSSERTYAPIRALSEALGATVVWDESSNSAYVTYSEDDAVAKVVSNVSPSVVAIIGNYDGSGETVRFNNPTVHGSGVIYRGDGHIITNAHVVKDIKNLTVILSDGTALPGNVLYSDAQADLAVVKINKIGLSPITFADSSSIEAGRTAITIGTPISLSMRGTVTKGIVSGCGVAPNGSYYKLIQTDATVNPGNSGGPLLNIKGELIGINTSKFVGSDVDNMAFAIPAGTVEYAINQFETYGCIQRPDLNFVLEQSWEAKIGLPTSKGLTVKSSLCNEVLQGDTITAVNSVPVHSTADWNEALKDTYTGGTVFVKIIRNGAEIEVAVNN